jgi:hypothetical protein
MTMTSKLVLLSADPAERWCFALGAVLLEMNGIDFEENYAWSGTDADKAMFRSGLKLYWGIENKAGLLEALKGLENDGYQDSFARDRAFLSTLTAADQNRVIQSYANAPAEQRHKELQIVQHYMNRLPAAGIAAWDWGRYSYLCMQGIYLGYVTKEEALELLRPIALRTQQAYSGWREFATAYLVGRQFWWKHLTEESAKEMMGYVQRLLVLPTSPWNTLDWRLPLNA